VLDAYIIDQLRRHDADEYENLERLPLQIPLPPLPVETEDNTEDGDESPRVIIIDL
jgi:hypothetical protein